MNQGAKATGESYVELLGNILHCKPRPSGLVEPTEWRFLLTPTCNVKRCFYQNLSAYHAYLTVMHVRSIQLSDLFSWFFIMGFVYLQHQRHIHGVLLSQELKCLFVFFTKVYRVQKKSNKKHCKNKSKLKHRKMSIQAKKLIYFSKPWGEILINIYRLQNMNNDFLFLYRKSLFRSVNISLHLSLLVGVCGRVLSYVCSSLCDLWFFLNYERVRKALVPIHFIRFWISFFFPPIEKCSAHTRINTTLFEGEKERQ